ncbi:hypothetical protein L596_018240 [Steinernema carpocapsae]|uniref:Uncharacterized protein n=1 Tax=Steinernema carpocapsae TaxID=34508 RepID=A0A4U5N4D0_STECR|nr:hypothetical protein L596_018240 [Steinernema carpocapsae]
MFPVHILIGLLLVHPGYASYEYDYEYPSIDELDLIPSGFAPIKPQPFNSTGFDNSTATPFENSTMLSTSEALTNETSTSAAPPRKAKRTKFLRLNMVLLALNYFFFFIFLIVASCCVKYRDFSVCVVAVCGEPAHCETAVVSEVVFKNEN